MTSSYLDDQLYLNGDSCNEEIETFKTYMGNLSDPIIELYEVPSIYAQNPFQYTNIPEIHRTNFRTMVHFISHLHSKGLSVENLEESNIVFHQKQIKFRGLKFVLLSRYEDRRKDLMVLHDVMKNLINKYNHNNYPIPTYFNDFLSQLRDQSLHGLGWMSAKCKLSFHMALQSHHATLEYITNFHAKSYAIHDQVEKYNYIVALEKMDIRNEYKIKDWTMRFDGSDPQVGALKDCFNYKFNGNESKYVGKGPARVVNGSILRFCRNNVAHLLQHMKKHKTSYISNKDIELSIMAFFDKELLSFQKMTFEYDIAHHFIPDYTSSVSGGCGSVGWQQESCTSGSVESDWQLVKSKSSKRNPSRVNPNRGRPQQF